jgi:hypothetical protein
MEKKPTRKQITEWKMKAEKWDKLDAIIAKFYVDEEGDELPEDEEGDGLISIGEAAASAFGWI